MIACNAGVFLERERWIILRCCHLGRGSARGLEWVKSDPKGEDDWLRNKGAGRGRGGKNTPARTHCLFAEPVHWIDGGSDWCGRSHIDWYLTIHGRSVRMSFHSSSTSTVLNPGHNEIVSFRNWNVTWIELRTKRNNFYCCRDKMYWQIFLPPLEKALPFRCWFDWRVFKLILSSKSADAILVCPLKSAVKKQLQWG